ncbi:MAG TPA: winged helix-turn-helix transcriptional regulator [Sphingomonas sp.]|nr:winged helix-turn-helix transcriptional regulator [Sphingomonas sp.]
MELEKITEAWESGPATLPRRLYDDACGMAFALELVGERWVPLILRELMFGPRRFGEIKRGLPGISANVLTQRLESLEGNGVLVRRRLPPPASVQVYELTDWGYESEVPLAALGRWAVRSPLHDPRLPLSGASLMMSFRTMLDVRRAKGLEMRMGFRIGPDPFAAHLHDNRLDVRRAEAEDPDVAFASEDAALIAAAVYGGQSLAAMEQAGAIRIEGDHALAERFVTLFPLPAKIA